MSECEVSEIRNKIDRIIALIKWKGAPLESKQNKIIKELSLIKDYSLLCLDASNSNGSSD